MNEFQDRSGANSAAGAAPLTTAKVVGGIILMPVGIAIMVVGIITHFAQKAGRVTLFPYAGRLVILAGMGVIIAAVAMAGSRMAVRFGAVTVVAGVGMMAFGFINMANPDLRFYAPLGFFIALAGGLLVWGGMEFAKEFAKVSKSTSESKSLD
jgi:hypothetical protein